MSFKKKPMRRSRVNKIIIWSYVIVYASLMHADNIFTMHGLKLNISKMFNSKKVWQENKAIHVVVFIIQIIYILCNPNISLS